MDQAHYYRIDMEYTAETSVVIMAGSPEQANELVVSSVNPNVKYTILRTVELSEEEKNKLLTHTEITEERTVN